MITKYFKPKSKRLLPDTNTEIEKGTYWTHIPDGDYPVTYFVLALCEDKRGVWTVIVWDINFPRTWDISEIHSKYVPGGAENIKKMEAEKLRSLIWP